MHCAQAGDPSTTLQHISVDNHVVKAISDYLYTSVELITLFLMQVTYLGSHEQLLRKLTCMLICC